MSAVKQVFSKPKGSYQFNLLNICGEIVSLVDTQLAPSERAIVSFVKYYKPEKLSDQDTELLKNTMRQVFDGVPDEVRNPSDGEVIEDPDTEQPLISAEPYPPCGEREKYLLLSSLLHRARILRQQIRELGILTNEQMIEKLQEVRAAGKQKGIQGKDSLLARTELEHLDKLQKFIDTFNKNQRCINVGDIAYQDLDLNLDDERVKKLLEQFVFFILQGHYPIEAYKKTDPTAPGFIRRLEKNPLQDFPKFMEDYKATKSPIPDKIARILEDTDLDEEAMKNAVKIEVELQKKKVLQEMLRKFPANDPFLKTLKGISDPAAIVDRLREKLQEYETEFARMNQEKEVLAAQAKKCEQEIAILRGKLALLEKQVKQGEELLEQQKGDAALLEELKAGKADAEKQINSRIQELSTLRKECNDAALKVKEQMDQLTSQNEILKQENETLKQTVDQLKKIESSKIPELQEALAKEKQKVEERNRALQAAQGETTQAKQTLLEKEAELANAKTTLAVQTKGFNDGQAQIEQLQKQLSDAEASLARQRDELLTKENELKKVQGEYQLQQNEMNRKEEDITELRQKLNTSETTSQTERETLEGQISTLTSEVDQHKTRADDLAKQTAALQGEVEGLKKTATGEEQQRGVYESQLRAAQENLTQVLTDKKSLEAQVAALKKDLEMEKTSKEEMAGQVTKLTEEKAAVEKAKVTATADLARSSEMLRASTSEAINKQKQYKKDLQEKNTIIKTLEDEKAALKQTYDASLSAETEKFKTIVDDQSKETQLIKKSLEEIAAYIRDPTKQMTIDPSIAGSAGGPLSTIIDTLKKDTPSEKKGDVLTIPDNTLNLCYLVFFVSFLWKLHFLSDTTHWGSHHGLNIPTVMEIINNTLNGGSQVTSKGTVHIPGLYEDYVCGGIAKGAEDCYCDGDVCKVIKPLEEVKTIKRYLDIVGRILEKIPEVKLKISNEEEELENFETHPFGFTETNPPVKASEAASRVPSDLELLRSLETKLTLMGKEYLRSSSTSTTDFKEFPLRARRLFYDAQRTSDQTEEGPILRRTLIIKPEEEKEKVFIVLKNRNEPGVLTYPILFYVYLFLMRDYFNHINRTIKTQCPLPEILKK